MALYKSVYYYYYYFIFKPTSTKPQAEKLVLLLSALDRQIGRLVADIMTGRAELAYDVYRTMDVSNDSLALLDFIANLSFKVTSETRDGFQAGLQVGGRMVGQHQDVDRTPRGRVSQNDNGQR